MMASDEEVTTMPGQVPPVADEREGLLAYIAQQRDAIRIAAYGLSDEQARQAPLAGPLSVGGLLKHVAFVEQGWIDMLVGQQRGGAEDDYETNFRMAEDETLVDVIAAYDEIAKRTESVVAGIDDMNRAVPVPKGVPWYPDDVDAWSVRWVLLHVIEETARHAGHADIVREAIDGATAFPLMAAAEKWPPTPWMQPWEPEPRNRDLGRT
jgi:uncharacterized damage-inducible protein DinB